MPVLHVCHEVSGWPNKRTWEQTVDIWPILLEFGLINDLLVFVTGRRWYRSLVKVTKRVKIEKSKLLFVIPKTISFIPYPYNFLVSYPLSLKLFCQLERFSFERRKVIGFAFTTLRDSFKKLAPLFHPIRSKTKTNRDSLARVFPHFASATWNYFAFWLVHLIICALCDWLEW